MPQFSSTARPSSPQQHLTLTCTFTLALSLLPALALSTIAASTYLNSVGPAPLRFSTPIKTNLLVSLPTTIAPNPEPAPPSTAPDPNPDSSSIPQPDLIFPSASPTPPNVPTAPDPAPSPQPLSPVEPLPTPAPVSTPYTALPHRPELFLPYLTSSDTNTASHILAIPVPFIPPPPPPASPSSKATYQTPP